MSDEREHITDGGPCWCGPSFLKQEDGSVMVVHNRLPPCPECQKLQNEISRRKVLDVATDAIIEVTRQSIIKENEVLLPYLELKSKYDEAKSALAASEAARVKAEKERDEFKARACVPDRECKALKVLNSVIEDLRAELASSRLHHQFDVERKDKALKDPCSCAFSSATQYGHTPGCPMTKALTPSTPQEAEAWAVGKAKDGKEK